MEGKCDIGYEGCIGEMLSQSSRRGLGFQKGISKTNTEENERDEANGFITRKKAM